MSSLDAISLFSEKLSLGICISGISLRFVIVFGRMLMQYKAIGNHICSQMCHVGHGWLRLILFPTLPHLWRNLEPVESGVMLLLVEDTGF